MSPERSQDPLAVRVETWAGADDIPADGWPEGIHLTTIKRLLRYRQDTTEDTMAEVIQTIYIEHKSGASFADVEPPIPHPLTEGEHQLASHAVYAAVMKGDETRSRQAGLAQAAFEREIKDKDREATITYVGHVFADLGYELKWVES